jgi:hypothetical protein
VAKVVPDRIFSIAFHPTQLKTLVVAGDKCGRYVTVACAKGGRVGAVGSNVHAVY